MALEGPSAQGLVGSPSMETLKNHGDVAPRNAVSGHGGMGRAILQLFSNLYDSVVSWADPPALGDGARRRLTPAPLGPLGAGGAEEAEKEEERGGILEAGPGRTEGEAAVNRPALVLSSHCQEPPPQPGREQRDAGSEAKRAGGESPVPSGTAERGTAPAGLQLRAAPASLGGLGEGALRKVLTDRRGGSATCGPPGTEGESRR